MSLQVDTHISGSHCVVWKNSQHYLDCRSGTTSWAELAHFLELCYVYAN